MNSNGNEKEGTLGENHSKFLKIIGNNFNKKQTNLIDFAYDLAKYGHKNQMRDSGSRYFEHIRAVTLILLKELEIFDSKVIISALLHDILEDSYILTKDRIRIIFGNKVAGFVETLTKPKKDDVRFKTKQEKLDWYFKNIKNASYEVKLIKLADRLHNTRTLGFCSQEKQKRKIEETEKYFYTLIEDISKKYPDKAKYIMSQFQKAFAKIK